MRQVEFMKFYPEHLRNLSPQQIQRQDYAALIGTEYMNVFASNFALSAWVGTTCIGAGGAILIYPHRAMAWAILSEDAAPYMRQIVNKVKAYTAIMPFKRLEAAVRVDFEKGQRFARLIGMKLETPEPMLYSGLNGEPELQYALVK